MTNKKTQNPIGQEEMAAYLNYLLSGQVQSEEHATQINKVAKHTTTVTDATIIAKLLDTQLNQKITEVMDVIQIHNRVLQKLGATPEMFAEAEDEYNEQLNQFQKELDEANKAQAEKGEVEAEVPEVSEEALEELKEEMEEHDAE